MTETRRQADRAVRENGRKERGDRHSKSDRGRERQGFLGRKARRINGEIGTLNETAKQIDLDFFLRRKA